MSRKDIREKKEIGFVFSTPWLAASEPKALRMAGIDERIGFVFSNEHQNPRRYTPSVIRNTNYGRGF